MGQRTDRCRAARITAASQLGNGLLSMSSVSPLSLLKSDNILPFQFLSAKSLTKENSWLVK